MRILIVEDDPNLRPLERELLESMGYEVDEATNADDALAMLRGDPDIELVMLDLGLPPAPQDISEGIRFLKEAMLWNHTIKVIVVSGQGHQDALMRCVEGGAFDILTKPFRRAAVAASLERAALYRNVGKQLRDHGKKHPVTVVADATSEEGLKLAREEVMVKIIRSVLVETSFNVSESARRLNITREHLYYFIKKYGIDRPAD
ncbi:MAG: response regulator [Burkholderiaceae bacterium]|jgi:two-component system, response regulator RegA|nr:response regulator [Burkholderiaceae bacterium]